MGNLLSLVIIENLSVQQLRANCVFIRPTVLSLRMENFTGAFPVLPAEYSDGKCRLYSKILSNPRFKNDGLMMQILPPKCHRLRTNNVAENTRKSQFRSQRKTLLISATVMLVFIGAFWPEMGNDDMILCY